MLYRFLFGAAAASFVLLAWDRCRQAAPVAGVHPIRDENTDFDLIGRVLEREYARYGQESACTVTRGLALVVASRRAHQRIAAALSTPAARPLFPHPSAA